MDKLYIVSIDVGVKHLAISLSLISNEFQLSNILWFELIDITSFSHQTISKKDCQLFHTKTYGDYMDHIFIDYEQIFNKASFILIERQPPTGYVVIEQLIFSKFRTKTVLISPNSIHYTLGWNSLKLDYEQRKDESIKFAEKYLSEYSNLLEQFNSLYRKHDVADTICILIYWLKKKRYKWIEEQTNLRKNQEKERAKITGEFNIDLYLEQFKFIPK